MFTTMEWITSHTYSVDSGKSFIHSFPNPNSNPRYNSLAFLLYSFILLLINLYTTTGRNASSKVTKAIGESNIELFTPGIGPTRYTRVPSGNHGMQSYALGDEDEEDELTPQ